MEGRVKIRIELRIFCSNTMLNYRLLQKFKLSENGKFNHLIIILSFDISNWVGIYQTCLEAVSSLAFLPFNLEFDPPSTLSPHLSHPTPKKKQKEEEEERNGLIACPFAVRKSAPAKGMFRRHSLNVTDILHPDG